MNIKRESQIPLSLSQMQAIESGAIQPSPDFEDLVGSILVHPADAPDGFNPDDYELSSF